MGCVVAVRPNINQIETVIAQLANSNSQKQIFLIAIEPNWLCYLYTPGNSLSVLGCFAGLLWKSKTAEDFLAISFSCINIAGYLN